MSNSNGTCGNLAIISGGREELSEAIVQSLTVMSQMLANAPKDLPPHILNAWIAVLGNAGLSAAEVRQTAATILAREQFYPTPATFLKYARPPIDKNLADEDAWLKARGCLDRFGYYASLTVDDVGGDGAILWALGKVGWERMCAEMTEENRAIFRAEFVRYYRLAVEKRYTCGHLAGNAERMNRAGGYDLTPSLCGRNDWQELPAVVTGATDLPALPGGDEESPARTPAASGAER